MNGLDQSHCHQFIHKPQVKVYVSSATYARFLASEVNGCTVCTRRHTGAGKTAKGNDVEHSDCLRSHRPPGTVGREICPSPPYVPETTLRKMSRFKARQSVSIAKKIKNCRSVGHQSNRQPRRQDYSNSVLETFSGSK